MEAAPVPILSSEVGVWEKQETGGPVTTDDLAVALHVPPRHHPLGWL
jgi:hypothetical protein